MKGGMLVWGVVGAVVFILIIASSFLFMNDACRNFKQAKVTIGQQIWNAAIANSEVEKTRGLMGCKSLPAMSGMYFSFDHRSESAIWMRGMVISLDIVWVSGGKVVGIQASVPPAGNTAVDPPRYEPPGPVDGIFEIASGEALRQGIKVGLPVKFNLK